MKNLRRLALSRIRDDSTLSRQYWTASGGWRRRILRTIAAYFVLPLSVTVIGFLIAFFGSVLGAAGLQPAACDLVFAGVALAVSVVHIGWVLRELISSRSLAVVSVLPDADRDFATGRLVNSLQKTLLFLAGSLLLGGGIAFGAELNVADTVQVMLLSILFWSMVASLSVIVPAFFPVLARQEASSAVMGFAMLLFFSGAGLASIGVVRHETLAFASLVILPTGWPILMIKYGVILKQPEYWRLLIPSGCVVLFAGYSWFRLLRRYRIQEFIYQPGSVAIAEFRPAAHRETADAGNSAGSEMSATGTASWIRDCQRRLRRWLKLPETDGPTAELTRDEAIARIRESGLTRRFDWSGAGFIERTFAKILNDEELLAAEVLSCGEPKWSQKMARWLVPASGAIAVVVVAAFLVHRQIAVIAMHLGLGGLIGSLIGSRWAGLWKSASGEHCAAMALLPIDARHVARMSMTLGAILSLLIFPFAVGVFLAVMWGHSGQFKFVDAVVSATKVSLVLAALHQWWFVVMQPCSNTRTIWKTILSVGVVLVVAVPMITGLAMLLFSGRSEFWVLAGAGLLFGTGWVAQRIQKNEVLHAPSDFVVLRTVRSTVTQSQQQRNQAGRGPVFWPRASEQAELLS
ncbi:MAG: hypothetical protein HQ518_17150 [Rhodopirellula sp.]|nr:hypothetical protein [Rhodopirellula sp.]